MEEKVRILLQEIDRLFEDPNFQSVFVMAGIHGVKYQDDGKLKEAIDAVKKLLPSP